MPTPFLRTTRSLVSAIVISLLGVLVPVCRNHRIWLGGRVTLIKAMRQCRAMNLIFVVIYWIDSSFPLAWVILRQWRC